MSNINNTYKRFQNYQPNGLENNLRKDFMEQNYKIDKNNDKKLDNNSLLKEQNLREPDKSFLEKSVKLGVNNRGFVKK